MHAQAEWDAKNAERERRLLRTILDDIEWEKANPQRVKARKDDASFAGYTEPPRGVRVNGRTGKSRFYEPEWKRNEREAKRIALAKKAKLELERRKAERAATRAATVPSWRGCRGSARRCGPESLRSRR